MKRMVADTTTSNPMSSAPTWLDSKDTFAVVTDYAQLEMLKGDALVNILKSTEIKSISQSKS